MTEARFATLVRRERRLCQRVAKHRAALRKLGVNTDAMPADENLTPQQILADMKYKWALCRLVLLWEQLAGVRR